MALLIGKITIRLAINSAYKDFTSRYDRVLINKNIISLFDIKLIPWFILKLAIVAIAVYLFFPFLLLRVL